MPRRSADDSTARVGGCRENKWHKDKRVNKNESLHKADAGEVLEVNCQSSEG